MRNLIHLAAGYLSVSGLGFMFACLILGAVHYLLPLAVFMTVCAVVSILSKPRKVALNLDNEGA